MKRRTLAFARASAILAFLAATSLSAALFSANDPPWKAKPYQEWNDQDLQRIFSDSPWVRMTTIERTWLPITSKDLPNEPLAGRDRGLPGTVERSSETSVGGELNLYVFWASSRAMRAASARKSVLHGDKKDLDVEKYANEPQAEYQVVLQAQDMAPFFRHDEKFFQSNAFLDLKKSKQRIPPTSVRYERDEKGLLVTSAVFLFPKKNPAGAPVIPSDEKTVEFFCKIEGSTVRVTFDLQKMIDRSGPDL